MSNLSWPLTIELTHRTPFDVLLRVFQSSPSSIICDDVFRGRVGLLGPLQEQLELVLPPALRTTRQLTIGDTICDSLLPLHLFTGIETFTACETVVGRLPPNVMKFEYTTNYFSSGTAWSGMDGSQYLQLTHLVLRGIKGRRILLDNMPAFPNLRHLEIWPSNNSFEYETDPPVIYFSNRSNQQLFPQLTALSLAPGFMYCFECQAKKLLTQLRALKGGMIQLITKEGGESVCVWPPFAVESDHRLQFHYDWEVIAHLVPSDFLHLRQGSPNLRCIYLPSCFLWHETNQLVAQQELKLKVIECQSKEEVDKLFERHALHGIDLPFDPKTHRDQKDSTLFVYHFYEPPPVNSTDSK